MSTHLHINDIVIRPAQVEDARALHQLAALDDAPVPGGCVLVAEADGEMIAAVEVAGKRAVADPFAHSAAVVSLLRLRAAQLAPTAETARPRRGLGLRARRAPSHAARPRLAGQ